MGTGVDADRGTGSAAKAREPGVALLFRRASALALVGMAAFTDIVITRRRAGWPVRRVSVRSRITRQSPAYAPFVAFADVSVAPPTIASADTASRIRFITVSTPIGETRFCYRNFKFPELLRNHFADLIGRGGSNSFAPLSGPFYLSGKPSTARPIFVDMVRTRNWDSSPLFQKFYKCPCS
jgi:hypothetical protein